MHTSLFLWINAQCACDKLAVSISTCVKSVQKQYMHWKPWKVKLQHVTEFMSVWSLVGYSFSSYCNRKKVKLFYWKCFSSMDFLTQEYPPCTCVSHSMNRNIQDYKKPKWYIFLIIYDVKDILFSNESIVIYVFIYLSVIIKFTKL